MPTPTSNTNPAANPPHTHFRILWTLCASFRIDMYRIIMKSIFVCVREYNTKNVSIQCLFSMKPPVNRFSEGCTNSNTKSTRDASRYGVWRVLFCRRNKLILFGAAFQLDDMLGRLVLFKSFKKDSFDSLYVKHTVVAR
jgi:hypothetical protein